MEIFLYDEFGYILISVNMEEWVQLQAEEYPQTIYFFGAISEDV